MPLERVRGRIFTNLVEYNHELNSFYIYIYIYIWLCISTYIYTYVYIYTHQFLKEATRMSLEGSRGRIFTDLVEYSSESRTAVREVLSQVVFF